jgi:hypothetical protein
MAIRDQKQSPPRSLPAARLFLDGVEEASRILLEAAREYKPDPSAGEEPSVTFFLRGKECDTIEDLKQLGGATCEIKIVAGSRNSMWLNSLDISRFSSTWHVFGSEGMQWRAYGTLLGLFEKNRIRWKTALRLWVWYILSMLVLLLTGRLVAKGHPLLWFAILLIWLTSWTLIVYKHKFQHSVVVLKYSYERARFVEYARKWWSIIVAALLGGLITALAGRLIRGLWP